MRLKCQGVPGWLAAYAKSLELKYVWRHLLNSVVLDKEANLLRYHACILS